MTFRGPDWPGRSWNSARARRVEGRTRNEVGGRQDPAAPPAGVPRGIPLGTGCAEREGWPLRQRHAAGGALRQPSLIQRKRQFVPGARRYARGGRGDPCTGGNGCEARQRRAGERDAATQERERRKRQPEHGDRGGWQNLVACSRRGRHHSANVMRARANARATMYVDQYSPFGEKLPFRFALDQAPFPCQKSSWDLCADSGTRRERSGERACEDAGETSNRGSRARSHQCPRRTEV